MIIDTSSGLPVSPTLVKNYFNGLVNNFFKILPMRENGEPSLNEYMKSLQCELIGTKTLIDDIKTDAMYMKLLCILEYLINDDEATVHTVKREVFRAINICNKLSAKYSHKEVLS